MKKIMKKKIINHLKAITLILSVIISSYSIAFTQDIIIALNRNDITEVKRLLNSARDPSMVSIMDGLLANQMERLLRSGADGAELLHVASEYGFIKTVRALIVLKVNPNGKENKPLFAAAVIGHLEIVQALLDAGANSILPSLLLFDFERRKEIIITLIDAGADLEKVELEYRGDKLLHEAVIYAGAKAVKLFIDKGAGVNATNNIDGDTPLHIAVKSRYDYSSQQPCCLPQIQPFPFRERKKMIIALIDAKADLEATNKYGDTPLHTAAAIGGIKTVRLLIKKGANVNTRNPISGDTPLHIAAGSQYSSLSTIRALINAGANLDAVNQNGDKPLDIASSQGKIRRVLALQRASTGFDGRQLTVTIYNSLRLKVNSCAASLTSSYR